MPKTSITSTKKSLSSYRHRQAPLWFLALAVTGILLLETHPQLVKTASADTALIDRDNTTAPGGTTESTDKQMLKIGQQQNPSPPREIVEAVSQDLFRKTGIPPTQVQVKAAHPSQWPDTCLGLAQTGEMCGQMIVPGWRIVVSDGEVKWSYRTDAQGRRVRIEP